MGFVVHFAVCIAHFRLELVFLFRIRLLSRMKCEIGGIHRHYVGIYEAASPD